MGSSSPISGFKMSHEKPAFFGAQPDERPAVQGHLTMKTVPYDPRFQNTNQNRNCWQNYVDYHRCVNLKGEDFELVNFSSRTSPLFAHPSGSRNGTISGTPDHSQLSFRRDLLSILDKGLASPL